MKKLTVLFVMVITMSLFGQTWMKIQKLSGGTDSVKLSDIQRIYFTNGSTGGNFIPMVQVQGGTFQMGFPDGLPVHSVTLTSYNISKSEVTQGQWKSVMGNNPSHFIAVGDNAPVEQVDWYDCISFCNKLSVREGKSPCYSINGNTNPPGWTVGTVELNLNATGYRLPTEAEWEFAHKGGTLSQGYIYSGSNTLNDVAWYQSNSSDSTHPFGTKAPNELGLVDMSGNVFEWCWDWYQTYYSPDPQIDPVGPSSGLARTLRGGSYLNVAYYNTGSYRYFFLTTGKYSDLGFRIVRR